MSYKKSYAEYSIKKWADAIKIIGIVFVCLSVLAAIIVGCSVDEDLVWISFAVLGFGGLVWLSTAFASIMVWGFGDIVGNLERISRDDTAPKTDNDEMRLPEL